KEHVEAILNSTSDAILVVLTDGTINQSNPACSELFGYSADEVLAQPLSMLVHQDHTGRLMSSLASAVASSSSVEIELEACRQDGAGFLAEVGLSPISVRGEPDVPIEISEVVCTIRNITQRKKVEQDLQELNKLKTEFLATAAHE